MFTGNLSMIIPALWLFLSKLLFRYWAHYFVTKEYFWPSTGGLFLNRNIITMAPVSWSISDIAKKVDFDKTRSIGGQ
jgi:hypothetical protein